GQLLGMRSRPRSLSEWSAGATRRCTARKVSCARWLLISWGGSSVGYPIHMPLSGKHLLAAREKTPDQLREWAAHARSMARALRDYNPAERRLRDLSEELEAKRCVCSRTGTVNRAAAAPAAPLSSSHLIRAAGTG